MSTNGTNKTEVTDWLPKEIWTVLILSLLVWVAMTLTNGTSLEKEIPRVQGIFSSEEVEETTEVYRKVDVQLSDEWSEKFFTLADENRTVWEAPGLEARTDTKELVLYPPLGDGQLGAHRWVQFRMSGGGRIKTCTHPKGTTWTVCK